MPSKNEFCDHLVDVLSPLGSLRYRAMFGGYALYLDETVFAIVDDDVLMLKADAENRPDYERRGIAAFRPDPARPETMPYFAVPDDVLAEEDALREWARRAHAAALRMAAARTKRPRPPAKSREAGGAAVKKATASTKKPPSRRR